MFSAAACPPCPLLRVRGFIFAVWGPQGPRSPGFPSTCASASCLPWLMPDTRLHRRVLAAHQLRCSISAPSGSHCRTTCLSAYRAFGGGAILVGAGGSAWTWLAAPLPPQLLLTGKSMLLLDRSTVGPPPSFLLFWICPPFCRLLPIFVICHSKSEVLTVFLCRVSVI